jgi:hypothetical protein
MITDDEPRGSIIERPRVPVRQGGLDENRG